MKPAYHHYHTLWSFFGHHKTIKLDHLYMKYHIYFQVNTQVELNNKLEILITKLNRPITYLPDQLIFVNCLEFYILIGYNN